MGRAAAGTHRAGFKSHRVLADAGAVTSSTPEAVGVFQREYDRINAEVYHGDLPPFPGVDLVDRHDLFAATNTLGVGPWRELRPFLLSRHVRGQLLLETIRHEVAHAAALLFDEDEDHGPAWRRHARLCGAREIQTLDQGDPLREDWPSVDGEPTAP